MDDLILRGTLRIIPQQEVTTERGARIEDYSAEVLIDKQPDQVPGGWEDGQKLRIVVIPIR